MNLHSMAPAWLTRWLGGGAVAQASAPLPERRSAASSLPRRSRRGFNAAESNHLTNSFRSDHHSLNQDLEFSLRTLRGRSRNLAKNNDYVKRFLRMVQNNVVGPNGFALSVPCQRPDGTIDEYDKTTCERTFARWARRGVCDVTSRLSLVQLNALVALLCARDGEAFIRRVKGGREHNAFGYALQVIDPVLVDDTYRADFPDGRRIRMGVETDAWGKPLAYHLLQDVETPFASRRVRVNASEIWHLFIQEEPSQVRGVPWIHTAMRRLHDLGGYEEAAVIAARVGASNMGFFIPPGDQTGDRSALADDEVQAADGESQLVRDATPGTFEELPPGYEFKAFDPDYPHANFDGFVKAMLRGVASGMGADYNTLANDLQGVNYSSIRSGKLETQDGWLCLQGWFREGLLEPLWPEWLEHAFVSGQLPTLPITKFDKYNVAVWQGRRWPWVDPLKDVQSRVIELNNGLNSYSNVMREMGRDPEAIWRELEKDRTRLKGLLPTTPPPPAQPAGGAVSGAQQDDDD